MSHSAAMAETLLRPPSRLHKPHRSITPYSGAGSARECRCRCAPVGSLLPLLPGSPIFRTDAGAPLPTNFRRPLSAEMQQFFLKYSTYPILGGTVRGHNFHSKQDNTNIPQFPKANRSSIESQKDNSFSYPKQRLSVGNPIGEVGLRRRSTGRKLWRECGEHLSAKLVLVARRVMRAGLRDAGHQNQNHSGSDPLTRSAFKNR